MARSLLASLAAAEVGRSDGGGVERDAAEDATDAEPLAALELSCALRLLLAASSSAKAAALDARMIPTTLRRVEDAAALLAATLARSPAVRAPGAQPIKPLPLLADRRSLASGLADAACVASSADAARAAHAPALSLIHI